MFNIAFHANSKADAKAELSNRNDQQEKPVSQKVISALANLIDALSDVSGKPTVGVGLSGTAEAFTLTVHRLPADQTAPKTPAL